MHATATRETDEVSAGPFCSVEPLRGALEVSGIDARHHHLAEDLGAGELSELAGERAREGLVDEGHPGRHVPAQHAQLSLHAQAHGDEVAIADPSGDGFDFSSLVQRSFVLLEAAHELALDPREQRVRRVLGNVGE